MRVSLKSAENTVLVTTMFVLSGALLELLLPGQTALAGNAVFRFILAVLYLGTCIVAFRASNRLDTLRALQGNPAILCLLLLTCVSPLWAAAPSLSLQRSVAVIGTSLVGITLAAQRSIEEQLRLFRGVFRVAAVLCLGCMIVAPQVAWSTLGLQGIFNQKNNLGEAMAAAILVDHYLPATSRRSRISKAIWLCIFIMLLILSRSATSLVSLCGAILIVHAYQKLRRHMRVPLGIVLLGIGGAVMLAGIIIADDGILASFLGRSADLTGRTELWNYVISMILRRPLLGYGYSGFWGGASVESTNIARDIGWAPQYSHNGYLELVLSLGVVGFVLFAILFWQFLSRAVQLAENRVDVIQSVNMWPLAFLAFFTIHNMAECTLLWPKGLDWPMFLSIMIGIDLRLICRAEATSSHSTGRATYAVT